MKQITDLKLDGGPHRLVLGTGGIKKHENEILSRAMVIYNGARDLSRAKVANFSLEPAKQLVSGIPPCKIP